MQQKRKQLRSRKSRENLLKLQRMLTYESSAIIILAMIPIIGYVVLSVVLFFAVIIFVPLMVKILWKLNRKGWLITLIMLTSIPYLLALVNYRSPLVYTIFSSIGMLNFFSYCWILKFVVKDWIEELEEDEFETDHEYDYDDVEY